MFTEPMKKSKFHVCCFFNWGAEFLETAADNYFTSAKIKRLAGNRTGSLEGLQKRKVLTPVQPHALFRVGVRWSAAVLSKMNLFDEIVAPVHESDNSGQGISLFRARVLFYV